MKKWFLLSVVLGAMPLSMLAQDDDMYFVPTKNNVAKAKATYGVPRDTYYSGSNRSIDEYNRRGSSYQVIPGDTLSDIIDFSAVQGVYPDSLGDFGLTRRMERYEGYEPAGSYWSGYAAGQNDAWRWHSPWYWSSYYPWYDGWYDPWYYGWYDPWYYGYSGYYWGYPYYYYPRYYYGGYYYGGVGGSYAHYSRYPGTRNHGSVSGVGNRGISNGRSSTYSAGTFGGSRVNNSNRSGSFSSTSNRSASRTASRTSGTYSNSYGNFGGSSSGSSVSSSRSSGSSVGSSSSGGGSFGGSRSSGGGARSGGGGGFGSGRR